MDTLEFGSGQQESSSGPPLHYLQVCINFSQYNIEYDGHKTCLKLMLSSGNCKEGCRN